MQDRLQIHLAQGQRIVVEVEVVPGHFAAGRLVGIPRVISVQETAELHNREAQERKREHGSSQTVSETSPPLAALNLRRCRPLQAQDALDCVAKVSIRPPSQVRHVEQVAQQIIPVQLDQRVEVQQRFDSRDGHDSDGPKVEPGLPIGQAPDQHRAGPEEEFKIRSGKADPKPLRLLRKQPGITHVAIKGRLEIQQQNAQFSHLAAEVFAGEPVRELVSDRNREHCGQEPDQRIPTNQADQVLPKDVPICDREDQRPNDGCRGAGDEPRAEAKANPFHQPTEQRVRVEQLETQVEQTAP